MKTTEVNQCEQNQIVLVKAECRSYANLLKEVQTLVTADEIKNVIMSVSPKRKTRCK